VVQQVLVHAGEYNQDAGRPVIVIAAGCWFEANVDQGAVNQVKVGDEAEVNLAAMGSQPMHGRVRSIVPLVSYDAGGPEATRPTRALGTGAPEWPSTFRVRIEADWHTVGVVPGMTGFARIVSRRKSLAVPVGVVTSLSAGSGIAHVVHFARQDAREVRCGAVSNGWIEILSGLTLGETVITDGFQFLRPEDSIVTTPAAVAHETPRASEVIDASAGG
jgi:multidrug efflux pump subunit AcrA (membrane-fusion protein)